MISETWFSTFPELPVWLLRLVFSVTLVCLVATGASLMLRRFSAAMRHRVWALSVVALLAMPVMILWSPELRLGWMRVAEERDVLTADLTNEADLSASSPAMETYRRAFESRPTDSTVRRHQSSQAKSDSISGNMPSPRPIETALELPKIAAPKSATVSPDVPRTSRVSGLERHAFWLLLLLVPAICGAWQSVRAARAVRRVVDEARLIQNPATLEMVSDICRRLGWNHPLELRQTSRTPIPVCVGWWRPCVLLPPEWRSWGDMTLRAVLAHEVSHIARRDVAWQFAARLACFLYWFHPMVWLAARKMRVERESACDDSVLEMVERPVDYASVLLRFAREMVTRSTPVAALPMASLSGLEDRVRAILDKSRRRSRVGAKVGRISAAAAMLVAAAAASLSPLSREIASVKAADGAEPGKKPSETSVAGGFAPAQDSQVVSWPHSIDGQNKEPGVSISGRVVLTSDPNRGVAKAKILGIPENPKASYVTAVADAEGNFHVSRVRSGMLFLAQSDERTLAGIARFEPQESGVVIQVGKAVSAHGRLLNAEGKPLASWPLEYCLVLDGSYLDEYHVFQSRDAKRLLGGNASTNEKGEFSLSQLAPGWTYRITCCPGTMMNGSIQPFITITNFKPAQSGITQLGDVRRPHTPTVDDVFLSASSPPQEIEKVVASATESASMLDMRVLIVAGSRKNEVYDALHSILEVSSPVNWTPGGATSAPSPWAKESALQHAVLNYAIVGLEVSGGEAATAKFLERYKVSPPAPDGVVLVALNADGHVVAKTDGRELFAGKEPSAEVLSQWLQKQAPQLPDAEKLLADALAQAKLENKRVFLRENSPGAGAYSVRLDRYVEQHRALIDKDYVCLKIDVRCPNADAVINRIRDYDMRDYSGGGFTLPWMIILDAAGKPLVSGTSPHGNIGIPESAQETSYFAWMLRATAQRLTDEEITKLVADLSQGKS
jgi:beta-lactamase regulating signal transducer with metallopeptidase domain